MRISDWSSDVCSSDLAEAGGGHADLAAADRVDNPLPAVRAAAGDAAVGLAVRLGQRPAPVPLVRTGGHAEAVGAERRPGRTVQRCARTAVLGAGGAGG